MTTQEKDPTADTGNWFFGNKAYAQDNDCAFSSASNRSHDYYDYNFSIPVGASIVSVKIKLWHIETSNKDLMLQVSWDGGSTWSGWAYYLNSVVGGNCSNNSLDIADATGLTSWTVDKLSNANFRVRIRSRPISGCFIYGSKITMDDNSEKKIEDVQLGDLIKSKKRARGWVTGKITAITRHTFLNPMGMIKITTSDRRTITLTEEHMFPITKLLNQFKYSERIQIGDHILNVNNEYVEVVEVQRIRVTEMINVEVDIGLLFVNGLLVHNLEKIPW